MHSTLYRQVHEAVAIERGGKNVLNSKSEYSRCKLPRIMIKIGEKEVESFDKLMTEEEILKSMEDETKKKKIYKYLKKVLTMEDQPRERRVE